MTFPSDRRITTRYGVLDVAVEVHATGVVARLARPKEHFGLSVVTAAVGQDEDQAVERLRSGLDELEQTVIRGHVVLVGQLDPPDDGLPVFRFLGGRRDPEDDAER